MASTGVFEKKIYNLLFLFFAFLAILPVWWFAGFITADGPCHIYNAAVFREFITGNTNFYGQFYTVNTELEPNWVSHLLLAGLMFVFSPGVADKIVITLCVLNLAFGFRYFVTSVRGRNHYLSICIFPFIWQLAMFMGFYNYMLSIGTMFWISGYWFNKRIELTWKQAAGLAIACIALYFMHLLGIFLSAAVMGLITLATYTHENKKDTLRQVGLLVVIMLPATILALNYIAHNSSSFSNEYKAPAQDLWNNLKDIFSLQSIHPGEYKLSIIIAQVLAVYLLIALVKLIAGRQKGRLWIMPFMMLVVLVLCYFFAYESMLGGSYIRYRLECLIYIFALIAIATVTMPAFLRVGLAGFFAVMIVIYFTGRWGAFRDIDTMVGEFQSLRPYIKDKSVILPLKYVHFPMDHRNEKTMASKVLLFSHVGEVLYEKGKQTVFLENYEANTGYFPLLWKEQVNPFIHLGKNIESPPPDVEIERYSRERHPIDHIVVWGRQGEILHNPLTQSVADTINKYYDLVYTTPLYKVELYTRKGN